MLNSLTEQTGGSNALVLNCVQENHCVNVILNILTIRKSLGVWQWQEDKYGMAVISIFQIRKQIRVSSDSLT